MQMSTVTSKIHNACASAKETITENKKAAIGSAVAIIATAAAFYNRASLVSATQNLMNKAISKSQPFRESAVRTITSGVAFATTALAGCFKKKEAVVQAAPAVDTFQAAHALDSILSGAGDHASVDGSDASAVDAFNDNAELALLQAAAGDQLPIDGLDTSNNSDVLDDLAADADLEAALGKTINQVASEAVASSEQPVVAPSTI